MANSEANGLPASSAVSKPNSASAGRLIERIAPSDAIRIDAVGRRVDDRPHFRNARLEIGIGDLRRRGDGIADRLAPAAAQRQEQRLAAAPGHRLKEGFDRIFEALAGAQPELAAGCRLVVRRGAVLARVGLAEQFAETAGRLQMIDRVVAGELEELAVGVMQRVAGMDEHRHRQLLEDGRVDGNALGGAVRESRRQIGSGVREFGNGGCRFGGKVSPEVTSSATPASLSSTSRLCGVSTSVRCVAVGPACSTSSERVPGLLPNRPRLPAGRHRQSPVGPPGRRSQRPPRLPAAARRAFPPPGRKRPPASQRVLPPMPDCGSTVSAGVSPMGASTFCAASLASAPASPAPLFGKMLRFGRGLLGLAVHGELGIDRLRRLVDGFGVFLGFGRRGNRLLVQALRFITFRRCRIRDDRPPHRRLARLRFRAAQSCPRQPRSRRRPPRPPGPQIAPLRPFPVRGDSGASGSAASGSKAAGMRRTPAGRQSMRPPPDPRSRQAARHRWARPAASGRCRRAAPGCLFRLSPLSFFSRSPISRKAMRSPGDSPFSPLGGRCSASRMTLSE